MTRPTAAAIMIAGAAGIFFFGVWYGRTAPSGTHAQTPSTTRRIVKYICPMHPEFTSDRPGDAPCCGMRMEPVYSDGSGPSTANHLPPGAVRVTTEQRRVTGILTETVQRSERAFDLRLSGRVAADERRIYRIKGAVSGWIRNTYDATTGSIVKRGERLATFYSPEFLGTQQAYIFALGALDRFRSTGREAPDQIRQTSANIQQYVDTLENLGMSAAQVEQIRKTRTVAQEIDILSPATAFVLLRNTTPGQTIERGEELYRLADLSHVWVLADLFQGDSKFIAPGRVARVISPSLNRQFTARISGVPPAFDANSRTLKVRLEVENPDFVLRPDMLVDVLLGVKERPALSVPIGAVIDAGLRRLAYVEREEGVFEPRTIETGAHYGDRVEIRGGLKPGEKVAVAGTFLIDSESRMKLALAGARGEKSTASRAAHADPVCGMHADPARGIQSVYEGRTFYFCSAPCKRKFDADPSRYAGRSATRTSAAAAGFDPVCGMVVEIADAAGTAEHRGQTYYFCNEKCRREFIAAPDKYVRRAASGGTR